MIRLTSRLGKFRNFSNVVKKFKSTTSKVELTQVRYPDLKRGNYTTLNDTHLSTFERILPGGRVLTLGKGDDLESYNTDWLRTVRGNSSVVLKPKTAEEVSEVLRFCNQERLAVCPQGGNTGLVGGSVPVFDEVILSTALMRNIESIDTASGVIICEAGCVLEDLDNALREKGLMMPLDLGAKGSCQIGGNVSTNAGGLRLMRYGSMHANTLGLVAVKADGTIVDAMNCLKKDNTGYAIHHLFVGSEGTLGVITKVAIQCPPAPKAVSLMFLGVENMKLVLETSFQAKGQLGEVLSSCELMDAECAEAVVQNMGLKMPLGEMPFYMLLETSGSNATHDEEKLNMFLEDVMGRGLVADGTVVTEPSRIKTLWHLRECIAEALLRDGYVYKYDISLPTTQFYELVPYFYDKLKKAGALRVCGFGHLGDGNIHFNVTTKEFSHDMLDLIEPDIYKWTSKYNGSVSAEHGIGLKKRQFVKYSKSDAAISVMRDIKKAMDPNGILNPYKVLPEL